MHINCNNIVILIIVCVGETIPDYNYIIIADKGRTTGHACHLYLNWDKSQSPKSSVRIKIILLNRPRHHHYHAAAAAATAPAVHVIH